MNADAAQAPARRRIRPITVITVLSVVALLVGYRRDIPAAIGAVAHAQPGWLSLLLLLALAGVALVGAMFRDGQIAAGLRVPVREGLALGTAAYAVNLVVKSSGLAGLSVFMRWRRARGHAEGAVVGGYLLSTFLNHLAFTAVLAAALAAVAAGGRLTTVDLIAAVLFAGYVIAHIGAAWAALRHPALVRRAYELPRRAAAFGRRLLRRPPRPPATDGADGAHELSTAMTLARTRPARVARAAAAALGVDLVHVVWLWAALHAVGSPAGLDVALVAYGIATLFGIVGFLPAGLGFVEVGMTATLASYHVPVAEAAGAVVLFRLAELWLPLAAGTVASRWLTRRGALAT